MILLTAQEMNAQSVARKQAIYDSTKLELDTKIDMAINEAVGKGAFNVTIPLKFEYTADGINDFLAKEIISKISGELEASKFMVDIRQKYSNEYYLIISWEYKHIYKINPPL